MRSTDERVSSEGELLRQLGEGISNDIRVAVPGIIESFDENTQCAVVRAAIRERLGDDGVEEDVEMPLLPDVPVYFPGGLGFDISYPVLPGMDCLLVFGDNCIDAWWQSGGVQNQTELRRHDLSDGFALVGFRSQPNLAEVYRDDAIVVKSKEETLLEICVDKTDLTTPEVNVVTTGDVNVTAGGSANVTTSVVNITAGTINLNGQLIINGEPYNDHKHIGVQSGGSITGVKA